MERVYTYNIRPYTLVFDINGRIIKSPKVSQTTCDTERLLLESANTYVLAIQAKHGKKYFEVSKEEALEILDEKTIKNYENILTAIALRCAVYNTRAQLLAEYKDSAEYWIKVQQFYKRKDNIKEGVLHINPVGPSYIDDRESYFYDDYFKVIENQYDGENNWD